jgi:putative DNA primase/helicase
LAEGIETALAVHLSTGLPSWACVSAGGLEAVILPEYVKRVIIAADNDENDRGQEAARKLAHRLLAEGRKVQIALPESAGMDWADMFIREVANV